MHVGKEGIIKLDDVIAEKSATGIYNYCVVCKSEINDGARMCPVCKCYQSSWRRKLYFGATVAGIITVTISLLTYISSTLPEIRKTLFWRNEVTVTAFDSKRHVVLNNGGDGKVFVSHITVYSDTFRVRETFLINRSIEKNDFLLFDLSTDAPTEWSTGSDTNKFWKKIEQDGLVETKCIHWHYFIQEDPLYQTVKDYLGKDFRSIPLDAFFSFYSGRDGHSITQRFKVFAVPYLKKNNACEDDPF